MPTRQQDRLPAHACLKILITNFNAHNGRNDNCYQNARLILKYIYGCWKWVARRRQQVHLENDIQDKSGGNDSREAVSIDMCMIDNDYIGRLGSKSDTRRRR